MTTMIDVIIDVAIVAGTVLAAACVATCFVLAYRAPRRCPVCHQRLDNESVYRHIHWEVK